MPAGIAGIHTIREIEDAERLRDQVGPGTEVIVVGSGFIGCEAAISMARRGAKVSVVTLERRPQIERLGSEFDTNRMVREYLETMYLPVHEARHAPVGATS